MLMLEVTYVLFNRRAGVLCHILNARRSRSFYILIKHARTPSILNRFKNDPFYAHLVSLFAKKNFQYIEVV